MRNITAVVYTWPRWPQRLTQVVLMTMNPRPHRSWIPGTLHQSVRRRIIFKFLHPVDLDSALLNSQDLDDWGGPECPELPLRQEADYSAAVRVRVRVHSETKPTKPTVQLHQTPFPADDSSFLHPNKQKERAWKKKNEFIWSLIPVINLSTHWTTCPRLAVDEAPDLLTIATRWDEVW